MKPNSRTAPQKSPVSRNAAGSLGKPGKKINLMTARFAAGDAIGNYLALQRELLETEFAVEIFADGADRAAGKLPLARASSCYVPTARDVLWFHYSIYSANFERLSRGPDKKILDFHGVCPPQFFAGYSAEHHAAARDGAALLASYRDVFDLAIAHSQYTAGILRDHGYRRVVEFPLAVSAELLSCAPDAQLSAQLAQAEYLLYVGRLVPQKNILGMLDFFQALLERRPGLHLILLGSASNTPGYLREICARIDQPPLRRRVWLLGPVRRPEWLKAFYRHARFLLLLSHWETFCVPVAEALSAGTPTIGSNATAIPQTMGQTGVLVDAADFAPALRRTEELLADPQTYGRMREQCLERSQAFTPDKMRPQLLAVLDELGCRR